jgi:hypothetical protein
MHGILRVRAHCTEHVLPDRRGWVFGNGETNPQVRGDAERRAPISVSFARAVQLGDETTRQVGRAEPAAPVPKSSFHARARGLSTFHDFELVHGAPLLFQHEEHGRGNLEDSVDAAATTNRLSADSIAPHRRRSDGGLRFGHTRNVTLRHAAVATPFCNTAIRVRTLV